MSGNYTIYHGDVWTDYTNGRHILTLTPVPAGLLQAAIPLFISMVGMALWTIVKRVWYHYSLRWGHGKDIGEHMERQQQVLLRNSSGDPSMSWDALCLWRHWRRDRPGMHRRLTFLIITGFGYWALWQATSVVSLFIWQYSITNLALIRGSQCGFLDLGRGDVTTQFRSIGLSQTSLAETWVSQCYGDASSDSGACQLYPRQSLTYIGMPNAECPFASPAVCQGQAKNSSPHRMDSGPIDSHLDLGINAPPRDRITYRKITTCSPIEAEPFVQVVNSSETDEAGVWLNGTILDRFFFGPVAGLGDAWTYEYNEFAPLDGFGYQIVSLGYTPGPQADPAPNVWQPNVTFSTITDGDVSLFFLSANHISYINETYDPVYSATVPYSLNGATYYAETYYVTVLSCVDQHQICNPNGDNTTGCTAPQAYLQLDASISDIGLNEAQTAAAQRIAGTLVFSNTLNSVNGRNAAALLASQTVSELIQVLALPVDQWRAEVENWYAVSLAKMQRSIIDFAGGPSDPTAAQWGTYPFTSPELAQTCHSQLVQIPAGYQNFNFDAIIIVTVVGLGLLVTGITFESCFNSCLKHRSREDQLRQWRYDAPFQLQRLAYNGRPDVGSFSDQEEDIPRTKAKLPSLAPQSQRPGQLPPTATSSTTPLRLAIQPPSTPPQGPSSLSSTNPIAGSQQTAVGGASQGVANPSTYLRTGSNSSQSISRPSPPAAIANASRQQPPGISSTAHISTPNDSTQGPTSPTAVNRTQAAAAGTESSRQPPSTNPATNVNSQGSSSSSRAANGIEAAVAGSLQLQPSSAAPTSFTTPSANVPMPGPSLSTTSPSPPATATPATLAGVNRANMATGAGGSRQRSSSLPTPIIPPQGPRSSPTFPVLPAVALTVSPPQSNPTRMAASSTPPPASGTLYGPSPPTL